MNINKKKDIIIAIPKGRIFKELEPFLDKANIVLEDEFYDESTRKLIFNTNVDNIKIIRVRSFDVPTFVAYGAASIGIAGSDVIEEFNYDEIYTPLDLGIGGCRLSTAYLDGSTENDWGNIRVATKYPNLTKKFYNSIGKQAEIVKLNGAMELAPILNICNVIVDLVSTGNTLKANSLIEDETILNITSKLIVNKTEMKTKSKSMIKIIESFREALYG